MEVKNNKVYIFAITIFIWNIINYYLESITKYTDLLNYLFWIVTLIICIISFKNEYKRDKYKDIIFKDIIMFILIYIIIYYLSGLILGFKKSPLSFEIFNILKNLIYYVLLIVIIETSKYYLIKENNSKIFLILITIIFIIARLDINYLNSIDNNYTEIFKYLSSNIIPLTLYGIVGTYLIKNSDSKTNVILQLVPSILMYTIPISPNLDWYLYGMFHLIYLLIIYIFIKYEIEKREENNKNAKKSIVSLIPISSISVILVLFVLGIFNYVPIGVMSNSMNPIFERGDIVIYKKINNINTIKKDDIICYQLDNIKVMHRVIKIEKINNKKYFTTKGDNLKTNDPLKVNEEQIIGVIKFTIPKLGYPSVWLYELLK